MSRLIKKPLTIPNGATVTVNDGVLTAHGTKGQVKVKVPAGASATVDGSTLTATTGTLWALAKNAIQGVTEGFSRTLEIEGVGYRAVVEGKELALYLGYAQPVRMPIPQGVTIAIEKNIMKISGIDNDLVGRTAAEIRAMKKPEPYKGKGIRYQGEVIRRKVGKKAAATAS